MRCTDNYQMEQRTLLWISLFRITLWQLSCYDYLFEEWTSSKVVIGVFYDCTLTFYTLKKKINSLVVLHAVLSIPVCLPWWQIIFPGGVTRVFPIGFNRTYFSSFHLTYRKGMAAVSVHGSGASPLIFKRHHNIISALSIGSSEKSQDAFFCTENRQMQLGCSNNPIGYTRQMKFF